MSRAHRLLLLLVLVPAACHAFPPQLLVSTLPPDAELKADAGWVVDNVALLDSWYAEWKFPVTRAEAVDHVTAALDRTNALLSANQSSAELWLFRVLLKNYLYNLEVDAYHQEILDDAAAMKIRFPSDPRPGWLLAVHEADAAQPLQSVTEYEALLARFPAPSLSPYFWLDYAKAAYFAAMPVHARSAFEYAARYFDTAFLDSNQIYKNVRSQIKPPVPNQVMKPEDVWVMERRGDGYGVLSRLFGVWVPARKDWRVNRSDNSGDKGYIAFTPGPLKNTAGASITYTILVTARANNGITFEQYEQQGMMANATMKRVPSLVPGLPFDTYEWTNPEVYKDVGGGHGYLMFLKRPEPAVKGYALEAPSQVLGNGQAGVQYYVFSDLVERYPGDIYYYALLDTCNDVFDQSVAEFTWFLTGLIIE